MATIGDRLRYLIHEHGMDQKEFAEIFGLKISTLNGYVTNYRTPDIEMQKKFADFFAVSVDYLIGRTDDHQDSPTFYMSNDMYSFIMDPQNEKYLKLAADIKYKGINPEDIISFSLK